MIEDRTRVREVGAMVGESCKASYSLFANAPARPSVLKRDVRMWKEVSEIRRQGFQAAALFGAARCEVGRDDFVAHVLTLEMPGQR